MSMDQGSKLNIAQIAYGRQSQLWSQLWPQPWCCMVEIWTDFLQDFILAAPWSPLPSCEGQWYCLFLPFVINPIHPCSKASTRFSVTKEDCQPYLISLSCSSGIQGGSTKTRNAPPADDAPSRHDASTHGNASSRYIRGYCIPTLTQMYRWL